jgi:hypothetical protein
MGRLNASFIHLPLNRVSEGSVGDLALDRWSTSMARQRRREDIVLALKRRQDQLPGAPGVNKAVKEVKFKFRIPR